MSFASRDALRIGATLLGMYPYVRPAPTLIRWLQMRTRPKVTNQPVEKLDLGDSTPEAMTVFYSSSSVCANGDANLSKANTSGTSQTRTSFVVDLLWVT